MGNADPLSEMAALPPQMAPTIQNRDRRDTFMKRLFILLILFCSLFPHMRCFAENQDIDDFTAFDTFQYVYDLADVIDESVEAEIMLNNYYLNKACRAQIVVLTVNHTSLPLNEYAVAVFNKLGIGDNILNNGLLFVMAIEDDDYWLSTGGGDNGGISKLYPTEVIKHDYDVYLEDYFARKEYSNGTKSFFEALFWRVSKLYGVDIPYYRIEAVYQQ